MNLKQAWERVALGGREIGGGPFEPVRYVPEHRDAPYVPYLAELTALGIRGDIAEGIAVGVFVGQLMAESEDAVAAIQQVNDDWLAGKLSR